MNLNPSVDETIAITILHGIVVGSINCGLTVSRGAEEQFKRIDGEIFLQTEPVADIADIGLLATGIEFHEEDLIGLNGSRSGNAVFKIKVGVHLTINGGISNA